MTELLAFRPVGTAFEKARRLLLEPFDVSLWAKLVIITFFVGGGLGSFNPGNNLQYSFNQSDLSHLPLYDYYHTLSNTAIVALILLIVIIVLALVLIFMYLRGVFSFVLIDALATGNVRIIRPFKANTGRGFRAFIFELVVSLIFGVAIVAVVLALVLIILWSLGGGVWGQSNGLEYSTPPANLSLLVLIIAVLIGVSIIVALTIVKSLIVGFFYDFAVPLMYFNGMGLRQSIGEVLGLVKRQPLQFVVYVVVRWVLEIVIAIILGMIFLFIFAVFFAIGLLTAIAMLEAAKSSLLLALPFALALAIGVALLIVVSAVISMPVQVYLRYYSLDFLRSLRPSYVNYATRFQ